MKAAALRIGLIGCGHLGQAVHLKILRHLPQVEVAGLAEPDQQRLEAACRLAPQAAAVADYRELIDRTDIDALVICLPNALHAAAGIAALESGKHLYLEKPLALNLDDGRSLVHAARHSGKVAMIGFNYRFNPLHGEVQRLLAAGRLGDLVAVRSVFTTPLHRMPEWKQTRQSGGGVLLDLASHHIDLVRFWLDQEVVEVFASVRSQCTEGDSATVELRLADGLLVQSFFSTSSMDDDRFEIYGRAGKLRVDRYHSWQATITESVRGSSITGPLVRAAALVKSGRFGIKKLLAQGSEPSHEAALSHFVAAAQTGETVGPNLEDGFQSLSVILAAEQSARTGRPVAVSGLAE